MMQKHYVITFNIDTTYTLMMVILFETSLEGLQKMYKMEIQRTGKLSWVKIVFPYAEEFDDLDKFLHNLSVHTKIIDLEVEVRGEDYKQRQSVLRWKEGLGKSTSRADIEDDK